MKQKANKFINLPYFSSSTMHVTKSATIAQLGKVNYYKLILYGLDMKHCNNYEIATNVLFWTC